MIPPPLPEVAGLSLRAPLLRYDAGRATLTRPFAARALDGASLILQHDEGASPATSTFDLAPFIAPAVQPYLPPPAVAWRTLLVDLRLLSHPEIVWTGTLPEGWNTALPAPRAEEVTDAATTLHRRYRSLVEERFSDYMLRTLECAECRADRASKIPPGLPAWHVQMRLAPTRCPHAPLAMTGLDALCRAHPELTFELLGWLEPAGARKEAEGATPARFALVGPLMEAMLAPWLVGEERRLAARTSYQGYAGSRYVWGRVPDPKRPQLPRWQENGVSLAAQAWGFSGAPEVLVVGSAEAEEPGLDAGAAPPIEARAAMPGEVVRRRRARKNAGG